MNEPCELIRDLMPLCHDGVASAQSRAAVEQHVQACAECRAQWERLCSGDYVERYMFDAEMSRRAAASYAQVNKKRNRWIAVIIIVVVLLMAASVAVPVILVMLLLADSAVAEVEVYDDVAAYERFFPGEEAYPEFQNKWGMDERIFPAEITPEMDVQDFRMVYYNPWDAQFMGYLIVQYDADAYAAECERLRSYPSTAYVGYYGVTEETTYDLLAVYADEYQGFVYALTDGEGTIIYAEQIFCNYQMDLDYGDYMHGEYFLDGFDARRGNAYQKEKMGE